jgi:lipopolysaccharide/colanic/teichoic acid biosynthesis glycosyltransferase
MIRVFKVFVPTSVLALFLSEVILISGCYIASAYVAAQIDGDMLLFDDSGLLRIGIVVGLILLALYFGNFYDDVQLRSRILLFQQLCMLVGVAFIVESLIGYWYADWVVPLQIMIPGSAFTLVAVFVWRLLFSIALQNAVGARRVLFLGLSPTVFQLATHLRQHPEFGLVPIGYLDKENASDSSLVRLGSVSDLTSRIEERQPHWIVIGNRAEIQPGSIDEFLELRFGGIQAEDAATLYETTFARVCASEIRPSELIFSETLQPRPSNLTLQSIYSAALACAAVIVLAPVLAFLALLLKASGKGPVLLREQRIGQHNVPFTMYRFRCILDQDGIRRVTSVGHFLRRFGLDRLPELFNVLRGEMSLVGPSADRPEFAARLSRAIPFYQHRHTVRPGMTGWAQIAERAGLARDVMEKLECDLYYIKNLSPSLDLFVLLRSARQIGS